MNLTDKNDSFKIPKSYFENQGELLESLGEIAEVQSIFSVPPAYFEKSEKQIFELLSNKPKSRIVRLIPYAVTIAAATAVVTVNAAFAISLQFKSHKYN